MEMLLILLGFMFCILGILGSFLPILPGPLTSWIGFLVVSFSESVEITFTFLLVTFIISLVVWILDYIVPAMGAKKWGGSRYGSIGATIGLIIGIIAPIPFGILIGPFVGAFLGEMLNSSNSQIALKAAFGSFLGFLTGTVIKFLVTIGFLVLYIQKIWMII